MPPPHRHSALLPPLLAAAAALAFFFLSIILYRKINRKRTVPADLMKPPYPPQRFSYSLLRRFTDSFAAANRLGQGGFGSVYKGLLPSGQEIAVKLMSQPSIQGEREFQTELSLASRIDTLCCPHVIRVLAFSTSHVGKGCRFLYFGRRKRKARRSVIVYEYMQNGSLQDALLHRKCVELMNWSKRLSIILSIAKGLHYLHSCCDPPLIHGDIKPSNILLDCNFDAKIADFGLAQMMSKTEDIVEMFVEEDEEKNTQKKGDDYASIIEENESFITEDAVVVNVDSYCVRIVDGEEEVKKQGSLSEAALDRISIESGNRKGGVRAVTREAAGDWWWKQENVGNLSDSSRAKDYVMEWIGSEINKERPKEDWIRSKSSDRISIESGNRKEEVRAATREAAGDWWWKQENVGNLSDSCRVKDYVMEWIGSEINKERPKKDWIRSKSSVGEVETKKQRKRKKLEWWASLDRDAISKKDKKKRKPREWWKEEFCNELTKKKKKKKRSLKSENEGEMRWQREENGVPERKPRTSRGSIDRWLDNISGEFLIGRRNSQDWGNGEHIPKSGGISSTPSMRGTVCYIAPEYGGGGLVSDKCDVYSFGVLLLVMLSGRRPLQVMASPVSEFERANLISWARQLAFNGRLLELVDSNVQLLNREQAMLCITIALLCLQRAPNKRPSMKEVVKMLSGKSEPPHLPFEFSPSPPSGCPFRSRKKFR